MKLSGKKAIVTGAAAGIGKSIALALAAEGEDVVIADVQMEKAENVAKEIQAMERRSPAITCDVRDSIRLMKWCPRPMIFLAVCIYWSIMLL